jgi:hypothetical protein
MSGSKKARVFVPLMKVDEEQRLVFGKITAQEVDQSGEMMDYETSKPNFESWSAQIEQSSGGLSKGNLRVMHGLSVAGKLTDINYDDADQSIEVCAKVVDDKEWEKVVEGCYTGFSVGGKYQKKWKETVDGETITKFTAVPNEVSLVDNPCVKSATFALVKADGAEEQVAFQHAEVDPPAETPPADTPPAEADATVEKTVVDDHKTPVPGEPSATAIAEKAGELAKAANDGSTWQDHISDAREKLMKGETSSLNAAVEQQAETRTNDATGEVDPPTTEDDEGAEGGASPAATDPEGGTPADNKVVEKATPAGVKQKWETSDGQTFEKKADAVAHEEELAKAAAPKSEAEQLRERLEKATNPAEPVEGETPLIEDFDRLAKAVNALSTPFDDKGEPALQKGMYTVNRFSNVLSDMASLSRSIKSEGLNEGGGDDQDVNIAADVIAAVKTLGASFIAYATDQVQELLAGMDDDVVVGYYDYYYNAVQTDPENGLAKDVCSLVNDFREPSREKREELAKAFGYVEGELEVAEDEEMSPPLKKRFDALEAENTELKKLAGEAVEKVEDLANRLKKVEDTPLPRAPKQIALLPGDGTFFGKTANTEEERTAILHDMLKNEGADALATKLIKLAHQNPQRLQLKGQ